MQKKLSGRKKKVTKLDTKKHTVGRLRDMSALQVFKLTFGIGVQFISGVVKKFRSFVNFQFIFSTNFHSCIMYIQANLHTPGTLRSFGQVQWVIPGILPVLRYTSLFSPLFFVWSHVVMPLCLQVVLPRKRSCGVVLHEIYKQHVGYNIQFPLEICMAMNSSP